MRNTRFPIRIISDKFRGTGNFDKAIELAYAIFYKCDIVPREAYLKKIEDAKTIITDNRDVPVLACALEFNPNYLVSGDEDFQKIRNKVRFKIIRTKELLKIIEQD